MSSKFSFIYCTIDSRDTAGTLVRQLIEERLIACANIIDSVSSIYRWQGEICEELSANAVNLN